MATNTGPLVLRVRVAWTTERAWRGWVPVLEGETGEFPARVAVTSTARENWQGEGCTTTLSEHRLLRTEESTLGELRHYQVSGEGSCADALEAFTEGGPPVTVGAFAFRAEFTWRD